MRTFFHPAGPLTSVARTSSQERLPAMKRRPQGQETAFLCGRCTSGSCQTQVWQGWQVLGQYADTQSNDRDSTRSTRRAEKRSAFHRMRHGSSRTPLTSGKIDTTPPSPRHRRPPHRGGTRHPARRAVGVIGRQRPDGMHGVGQDDPRIDVKRTRGAHFSDRLTQYIDMTDQHGFAALEQVDREEVGSVGNPVAAIVGHGRIVPIRCIRRKALRFSALLTSR